MIDEQTIAVDREYMKMAVDLSLQSPPSPTAYRVGAVVVTAAGEVFAGYTHETGSANHAEEEAIAKAHDADADLHGATIYSSMEPCSTRRSKPRSCTQLIIEEGFGRVVYALDEPIHFVDCRGREMLSDAGIKVDLMSQFAAQVESINAHVLK